MGDSYCNLCDKTIKLKHKRKRLNIKSYMVLSESIFNKYCVKNPEFFKIEEIFEKHLDNYNKMFRLYLVRCEWALQFKDTIIRVISNKMNNLLLPCGVEKCNLIYYLATKIECLNRSGLEFNHIFEMNLIFTTGVWNMTYNHYLDQHKYMIEWVLNKKNTKEFKSYKNSWCASSNG